MYIVHRPTSTIYEQLTTSDRQRPLYFNKRALTPTTTATFDCWPVGPMAKIISIYRWQVSSPGQRLHGNQRWQSTKYIFTLQCKDARWPLTLSPLSIFSLLPHCMILCATGVRLAGECSYMYTLYVLAHIYSLHTDELTDNLKIMEFCEKFKLICFVVSSTTSHRFIYPCNDRI